MFGKCSLNTMSISAFMWRVHLIVGKEWLIWFNMLFAVFKKYIYIIFLACCGESWIYGWSRNKVLFTNSSSLCLLENFWLYLWTKQQYKD